MTLDGPHKMIMLSPLTDWGVNEFEFAFAPESSEDFSDSDGIDCCYVGERKAPCDPDDAGTRHCALSFGDLRQHAGNCDNGFFRAMVSGVLLTQFHSLIQNCLDCVNVINIRTHVGVAAQSASNQLFNVTSVSLDVVPAPTTRNQSNLR